MAEERIPLTFRAAPEVEEIARPLIRAHHQHLIHARVRYLFRSTPEKVDGKPCLGTARKISGLNAYLSGDDDGEAFDGMAHVEPEPYFLVTMCEPLWDALEPSQRIALTDHELSHLFIEDGKYGLIGHDLEEFIGVVHRHGLWITNVEAFASVVMRKVHEAQAALALEDVCESTISVNGVAVGSAAEAADKIISTVRRAARGTK
jgi:hypothetical protein